jgi:hypothetical protein
VSAKEESLVFVAKRSISRRRQPSSSNLFEQVLDSVPAHLAPQQPELIKVRFNQS